MLVLNKYKISLKIWNLIKSIYPGGTGDLFRISVLCFGYSRRSSPKNKSLINENEFPNLQNLQKANRDICGIKFANILNAWYRVMMSLWKVCTIYYLATQASYDNLWPEDHRLGDQRERIFTKYKDYSVIRLLP